MIILALKECKNLLFMYNNFNQLNKSYFLQQKQTRRLLSGILTQTLESKSNKADVDKQKFDLLYPTLVQDLIDQHSNNANFNKRFSDMLMSNFPKEKQLSGFAVLKGYKMFELPENQSTENIQLASVLGWCVNLLLTSYNIITDITNHTNLHWCQDKGAEIEAVHHALLMEKSVFLILKKYFSNHVCYQEILQLFHKVNFKFAMGLKLDAMYRSKEKVQLEDFKIETYQKIVKYISSYPFVALPMLLALYCSENSNLRIHGQVKTFLFALGEFLATQDAVINCFGNNLDLNASKLSDISTGKCNWLIVEAVKRATENQKRLLQENYGRSNLENQILVYNIYNDLGLFDIFLGYSEENFYNICEKVLAMSKILPSQYFIQLVEISFGRTM